MSNSMNDDSELKMIDIEFKSQADPTAPSRLAHQFESMAVASRSMEAMLNKERTYSRQLREYTQNILARVNLLEKQEKELTERLKELEGASEKAASMEKELADTQSELKRYQDAWVQVLEREKRAQQLIVRAGTADRRILELEGSLVTLEEKYAYEKETREKTEQSLSAHRTELQTTILRLQSSEARYMDITRELEAMYALRKNHAADIARIEAQAKEKSASEFYHEKAHIEREFAQERNRLENEIARLREEMANATSDYNRIREQLTREIEQTRAENQKLKLDWESWETESKAQSTAMAEKLEADYQAKLQAEVQAQVQAQVEVQVALEVEAIRNKLQIEHDAAISQATLQAIAQAQADARETALVAAREELNAEADQRVALAQTEAVHNAQQENERKISAYRDQNEAMVAMIAENQKQLSEMLDKVIEAWGEQDPSLRGALSVIRETCQTRSVISEPTPAKSGWPTERVVIRGSGPKLNC